MEGYAREAMRLAINAGVKIALGTDAAMPLVFHGDNAWEFELMVEYGMSPMRAIMAGTRNAAENLGLLDEIGTIESGKLADIVVVNGDPLQDIHVLRDSACIELVIKDGAVITNKNLVPESVIQSI
jgi:imidazolonepropionase-like amidohydrolase